MINFDHRDKHYSNITRTATLTLIIVIIIIDKTIFEDNEGKSYQGVREC